MMVRIIVVAPTALMVIVRMGIEIDVASTEFGIILSHGRQEISMAAFEKFDVPILHVRSVKFHGSVVVFFGFKFCISLARGSAKFVFRQMYAKAANSSEKADAVVLLCGVG